MGRRLLVRGGLSLLLARLFVPASAHAQTSEGMRLRGRTSALLDGRIRAETRRGPDGTHRGHAYGLVDAPFAEAMRALCELESYARIIPTAEHVRVLARARGHARIELRGDAPLVGDYVVLANAVIAGHDDGTHSIAIHSIDPAREMGVRIVLSRTPGGVRTIVGASITIDPRSLPAVGRGRVHRNAAASMLAGVRRVVRAGR